MNLQITRPEANGPLHFTGALDIYSVDALRDALLQEVKEQPTLALDLGAVLSCDVVALQLLHAAQRSAAAAGKSFSVRATSAAISEAIADVGLTEPLAVFTQSA